MALRESLEINVQEIKAVVQVQNCLQNQLLRKERRLKPDTTDSRARASLAEIQPHNTQAGQSQGKQPDSTDTSMVTNWVQGQARKQNHRLHSERVTTIRCSPTITIQIQTDKARPKKNNAMNQEQKNSQINPAVPQQETSIDPYGLQAGGNAVSVLYFEGAQLITLILDTEQFFFLIVSEYSVFIMLTCLKLRNVYVTFFCVEVLAM